MVSMNETVSKTYTVPEENLPELKRQLEKLAKKATKLGLTPITMKELGHEDFPYVCTRNGRRKLTAEEAASGRFEVVYFRFYTVEVAGERPRLSGWEFIATLQHLNNENGETMNMLRTSPSFTGQLPAEYRTASPHNCDHCRRSIKTRKETFIVRHEDGSWKQVGRNCTQDFLGNKDPHKVTEGLEHWLSVDSLFRDAEEGFGMGFGGEYRFPIEEFLTIAAAMVRVDGWCSRAKAKLLNGDDYRPA